MKKLIVVSLFLVAVVILSIGKWQYDNRIEKNGIQVAKAFKQNQKQELKMQKQKLALLEKDKNNSVLDWLKYRYAQQSKITVSAFGSSVTAGAGSSTLDKHWTGLLQNFLRDKEGMYNVSLERNGFGGYTTQRLIAEKRINDVLANKPDVVIIEPTIINNYAQNISILQTNQDILFFVNEIRKKLPNTLVIIQSSNPTDPVKFSGEKNELGLDYEDYANDIKTFTEENHLNYVDVYSGVENLRVEKNKRLNELLKDDRHPNDLGYEYWFETLKTSFEKVPLVNS
ncbi:SGNH/GDSL hydrolase family protein [Neobacillus vireti]|uniref:SGNH/GDSL hydrolase family protein n=1 Tax=Neobacillus vireti TaxID=220686 RepID=UPI002FFF3419